MVITFWQLNNNFNQSNCFNQSLLNFHQNWLENNGIVKVKNLVKFCWPTRVRFWNVKEKMFGNLQRFFFFYSSMIYPVAQLINCKQWQDVKQKMRTELFRMNNVYFMVISWETNQYIVINNIHINQTLNEVVSCLLIILTWESC